MPANDLGAQAFYREALTGIPHPLIHGQTLNYGQLQDLLTSSHRAAAIDAYAVANRLDKPPTAAAYQQAMFDHAHAALLERAAAKPGEYAFPASADSARRAPNTARAIAHGNYVQPDAVQNAASLAQRYGDVAGVSNAYAAPGMAVQGPRTIAVAAPAPKTRVLRATGPIVAGN
ncbi:hypothetical protein KB206_00325 [Microvirga sp. STS02]|uniref:hypothetical protein n=1 Tax=Hymenobacter negativus TaxID=2795026 RepID=UPI0018DC3D64|nr:MULTISPECIES: hypothetical protein [Bacteria]MBH8567310.1 hypothetical protein [Hymenobacter negativus]MBR7207042.1 hypothetical protein [Microvirga sp. STS02]